MIRPKGGVGTGDVSNAVTHIPTIRAELRRLKGLGKDELYAAAKDLQATNDLVREVAEQGKLPVALFTAGGIAPCRRGDGRAPTPTRSRRRPPPAA